VDVSAERGLLIVPRPIAYREEEEAFPGYDILEVNGGDLSGYRQPNVVVDIGFGERVYWAFTNEYGQLVRVSILPLCKSIISLTMESPRPFPPALRVLDSSAL